MQPLRFEPILKTYLWGGRKLAQLGKRLGDGEHYAESWEICDHDEDQSVVLAGDLAGNTLGDLVRDHGRELLGMHYPQTRFPLLFKILDAQQKLSVQVHPSDERAARLSPPDFGKTEAWVVIDAEPNSLLYVGFKPGFDRAAVERELHRGTLELCLHRFEPDVAQCVFLPAGVVHAIGGGLLIAEIQQSSDVTYRLFDWNRVGPDGQPRKLHIAEALDCIDFDYGPGGPQMPQGSRHAPRDEDLRAEREDDTIECLVACDKFILDRWRLNGPATIGGDDRFHILAVIEGEVAIAGDPFAEPLRRGGTALLPAACGETQVIPADKAVILDAYLPADHFPPKRQVRAFFIVESRAQAARPKVGSPQFALSPSHFGRTTMCAKKIGLVLVALFAVFVGSPASAQVDYGPWKKTDKGNYYRVCSFPKGGYQYLILFVDKPKWVYWYNHEADKFWSCCPTVRHPKWGEDTAAGKDLFLIAIVKAAKIEDCTFPEDDGPNFKPGATAKDKDGTDVTLGCPPPDLPEGI